eukprot:1144270-Pelagomonas_calceolata.AAC.12
MGRKVTDELPAEQQPAHFGKVGGGDLGIQRWGCVRGHHLANPTYWGYHLVHSTNIARDSTLGMTHVAYHTQGCTQSHSPGCTAQRSPVPDDVIIIQLQSQAAVDITTRSAPWQGPDISLLLLPDRARPQHPPG